MQTKYFECSCQSLEHMLRFCYDEETTATVTKPEVKKLLGMEDDECMYPLWDEVYVEVILNPYWGFWKRVIPAFKYMFTGNAGRFAISENASISRERLPELITFLEEIRDYKEESK